MKVIDNLEMGAYSRVSTVEMRRDLDRIYSLFPILAERRKNRAGALSGGQQQMLAIGRALMSPMNKLYYERADYSVVVKNRAPPPKAWRWEIYRAGNVNPIKQSSVYFDTTAAARRAGKEALNELLNKLFA
jgi:hypothetical protein